HTELRAAPCPSEYRGNPDRHRDSPKQKCAETEEGPNVLYAGRGSERLAHAVIERVMEAEVANEQVTDAGIARESGEVGEADDDQRNDGREQLDRHESAEGKPVDLGEAFDNRS